MFKNLLLLALCAVGLAAHASALDDARQRGKLIAAVGYPVPEYKGGMKFRTPEALDSTLLADVAQRLRLPSAMVGADARADIALLALGAGHPSRASATVIGTGYSAAPMAILRTDTDIKRWEQLKGRKVCLSEGGLYVGTLAAKYGALEIVQRAPADSLLALRTGACDAAVHDSALLEELIKLPEWKKFSARLPAGPAVPLVFVVPAADGKSAEFLRRTVDEWKSGAFIEQAVQKAVRHIAFEVYLDQDVPDCH
jgi:polar amino acid transport system substrate-binding protein